MLANILLSLFGLYTTIQSQNIVFNATDIQCNEIFHPYNKYYGSLCDKWKQSLVPYFQKVHCVIAFDNKNEVYSGCSPSLGSGSSDKIHTEYVLSKKCIYGICYKNQYDLTVNVKLNDHVNPIFDIFCCIFVMGLGLYNIFNNDYRYPVWYGRYLQNNIRHQIRWNKLY